MAVPKRRTAREIALAVLSHARQEDAARALGRSLRWLYFQLEREDVQQEIAALREEIQRQARDILLSTLLDAVHVLRDALHDNNIRIRVDVAKFVVARLLPQRIESEDMNVEVVG